MILLYTGNWIIARWSTDSCIIVGWDVSVFRWGIIWWGKSEI